MGMNKKSSNKKTNNNNKEKKNNLDRQIDNIEMIAVFDR